MSEQKRQNSILGKFTSIRTGMQISFSILILGTILVAVLVSFRYTRNALYNNSTDYTERLIEQVNTDLDSYIEAMERIATVAVGDSDIRTFLFDDTLSDEELNQYEEQIATQFETYMKSRSDICNIGILSPNGRYVLNSGRSELNPNTDVQSEDWYQKALKANGRIVVSSSHVQNAVKNSYQWVVTLSCKLPSNRLDVGDGVFFVDLNYNSISELCENNSIAGQGYIYILDKYGNIVYHPQQQLLYGGLKKEYTSEILDSNESEMILGTGSDSKLYTKVKSLKSGWTVVGVIYTSELQKMSNQSIWIYMILAFVLFIVTLLIVNWMANSITQPLKVLRESIEEMEEGHFDEASVEVSGNNEIAGLTKSFNDMTNRIDSLVQENVKEQQEKRRIELKALQSQINPHFLYNTLDSIIWMAEGNKSQEVVKMTSALARLMRQSISNEDETILIKQELQYIENYLTIQKMRYQDQLEFHFDVDPIIYQIYIVKLVLQPLVENAIYHGIKYKEGKSLLQIIGYKEEQNVIIVIEDNGSGMDAETLEHIFDRHKVNYRSNGVGVYNVQKRIQLYYGEEYGLHYESELGKGTRVTIRIPFNREG